MARAPSHRPIATGLPVAVGRLGTIFAKLPGIGEKVGLRHALSLALGDLGPEGLAAELQQAIGDLRGVTRCGGCRGLAEVRMDGPALCPLCADTKRDRTTLCVVARQQDLMAIERSGAIRGRYFILGQLVSPLDGVDADDLPLDELTAALSPGMEMILCLPQTVEGEATAMVLRRALGGTGVRITKLAAGISHGADLEFADPVTMMAAVTNRLEIR